MPAESQNAVELQESYKALLFWGQRLLHESVDNPRLEAELLLKYCCGKTSAQLITDSLENATTEVCDHYRTLVRRRESGEPVAYLVGERSFWSFELSISNHVLIPRPETELLVEQVLSHLRSVHGATVLELGTGSGAIAIAIAQERPDVEIIASDISRDALNLAAINANKLGAYNIRFLEGNWYEVLQGGLKSKIGANIDNPQFDLVVSNPPYVAEGDPYLSQGDLRFEPNVALVAGEDGLDCLKIIIDGACTYLKRGGWIMLEHGYEQGTKVRALLEKNRFTSIKTLKDYAANERVSIGRCPGDTI